MNKSVDIISDFCVNEESAHEKVPFLVSGDFCDFFRLGLGWEPLPYCDNIPTKSPFCMVVVLV